MTGMRILVRRGGAVWVAAGTAAIVLALLILDLPTWWASDARFAQTLLRDTGGYAVAPVAAVAATAFVGSGCKIPDAVDVGRARSRAGLLVLRLLLLTAAAMAAHLAVAGCALVCLMMTGGGSASPLRAVVASSASMGLAALVGGSVGSVVRRSIAPLAGGLAGFALTVIQLGDRNDGMVFVWPTARVPSFLDVHLIPFLLSAAVIATAVLTLSLFAVWRGWDQPPTRRAPADARSGRPVGMAGLALLISLACLASVAVAAATPLVFIRPRTASTCAGTNPKVCVWDDNVEGLDRIQRSLDVFHDAIGTWPANINQDQPVFYEEGLDVEADGRTVRANSPLTFDRSRFGVDRGIPSYYNVALNWTTGACKSADLDPGRVAAVLEQIQRGEVTSEPGVVRTALGIRAGC